MTTKLLPRTPLLPIFLGPLSELQHAFNVRFGFSRKDDTIPEMYFKEPFNTGPLKGHILKRENFSEMLDEYYNHWGWDVKTGIPTRETLESLGLEDIADDLERRGLLPTA